MHYVFPAILIIVPLWVSANTKKITAQYEPCGGRGTWIQRMRYKSPPLSWELVETSVFHHSRVVFTVKDGRSQKHAENRSSSKVLQAHFSACGPHFSFLNSEECVPFTSTLVNKREENILRMCSNLRILRRKHSSWLSLFSSLSFSPVLVILCWPTQHHWVLTDMFVYP